MENYIRRTLTYTDDNGHVVRISDADLISIPEPLIVLGEPGMGKSWMLSKISQEANLAFRSAASFVAHPHPISLVTPGRKVVIDGLDELPAAQESDPVYRVLGQLLKAGAPPFILSCRVADWRGAVARQDIASEYGVAPREMTLERLSRESATKFLETTVEAERAQEIIAYLEQRGIPDLYGNPLTLNLFAEIAAATHPLPLTRVTRPALLQRAISIMWNERSDRHDKSPLSNLDEQTALSAAGAASAALILTGSEAISLKPSGADAPRRVHAANLRVLPGGENIRSIVGSRLFANGPDGPHEFRPIHRSIAEFLGARWLANAALNDETRERILSMITFDAGVPASLRGIHAWLPHFDQRFAGAVIAADPYGLLRYGDADSLSVDQGRQLLSALRRLQVEDPYFRAEDWESHSARGLAHPELREEIREILLAEDANIHLRTLLLEAIRGTNVAGTLVDDLRAMMLGAEGRPFSFRERHDAAQALIELGQSTMDWAAIIARLNEMGDYDSTRLALEIMGYIGYPLFTAAQVAETVLCHLGLLEGNEAKQDRSVAGVLYFPARDLPDAQIEEVLDAIAARVSHNDDETDWHSRSELSDFVARLIVRRIENGDPDPQKLLSWLRITPGRHNYPQETHDSLTTYFRRADEVRHAIQREVIFVGHEHKKLWGRVWQLADINVALELGADDVIFHLNELAAEAAPSKEQIEIWRELAEFARRSDDRVGGDSCSGAATRARQTRPQGTSLRSVPTCAAARLGN
jgi:hypothetical protein